MKRKIIRGGISFVWAAVSIVQFTRGDIMMGLIYAAIAGVFFVSMFANKNKQN